MTLLPSSPLQQRLTRWASGRGLIINGHWSGTGAHRGELSIDSWMSLESSPRCKRIPAKELFYSSAARGLNFYVSLVQGWPGQRRQIKIAWSLESAGVGGSVSLLAWPLVQPHERQRPSSARSVSILENLIWQNNRPLVWRIWRKIHEATETSQAEHPFSFLLYKKGWDREAWSFPSVHSRCIECLLYS